MSTAQLRQELHKHIDQANDRTLRKLLELFNNEQAPVSNQDTQLKFEMNKRAAASEQDIAEGRTTSSTEFKRKVQDWKQQKRTTTK